MTSPLMVMLPLADDADRFAQAVAENVPDLRIHVAVDRADALKVLPEAVAAFGTLDAELLGAANQLAWLQAPMAAPPAGYFFPELVDHPVTVTNFRGIYNDHVATHAVALLLALSRGLPGYLRQQLRGEWVRHLSDESVMTLHESTVLVVGVGGIGAEVARLMHAFGATVIGVDPRRTEPPVGMSSIHPPDQLDMLLTGADAVILTLPHTPESEGLFGAERLALMPPQGLLVNIGRGATVQLDAVLTALQAGTLGGVALDVFEIEPLPPDHPLWREPGALLTPHVAVVGPHIDERRREVVCENVRRFTTGRKLINVVDKSLWY